MDLKLPRIEKRKNDRIEIERKTNNQENSFKHPSQKPNLKIITNFNEYVKGYKEHVTVDRDMCCRLCSRNYHLTKGLCVVTRCQHLFHQECMDYHLKIQNLCPICCQHLRIVEIPVGNVLVDDSLFIDLMKNAT